MRWESAIETNHRFFGLLWQAFGMAEKMIVFFDGECQLCQSSLRWLNRVDGEDRLLFAPLQGETARQNNINRKDDSMAVIEDGEVWRASEAVMRAFLRAGGPGLVFGGILLLTPEPIREWGYRLVARYRLRLMRNRACGLPEEGMREKLLA